jgi:HK97 family phage prohead protease
MLQTKEFAFEVKKVGEDGEIEGYASTFGGAPDSYGDVVMPGAFADTLVAHKRAGTMPLMLWNHKASELPIGNWTDMAEDGKGLWSLGQLDIEDPMGQRVHKAMKRKSVRGLSIGYETIESEKDDKRPGARLLQKLDLWEVSPTNFPANRRALITGVKATSAKELADQALTGMNEAKARLDEMEQKMARRGSAGRRRAVSGERFVNDDGFKAFAGQTRPRGRHIVEVKDITSLTTDAAGSVGGLIQSQRLAGIMLPTAPHDGPCAARPGQTNSKLYRVRPGEGVHQQRRAGC